MTPKQKRDAANSPWPRKNLVDEGGLLITGVAPLGRTRGGRPIVLVAPDHPARWLCIPRIGWTVEAK